MTMLTEQNCFFSYNHNGLLQANIDGQDVGRVKIVCTQPLTQPDAFLCVIGMDDNEKGIIESIDDFTGEQRAMIAEDIRMRYFCPVISEIHSIKDKMGSFYFDVVIQGRKKNFMVRDLSKNIRQTNASVTITDTDGNRYKIEDIQAINRKSRRKLEPYLY
ncbi:MAG: DUF1854 domain-containing protein [Clostridia bacterium]|nr:DUF1854 domain-containing protein [Clostridia bacterium]